MKNLILSILLFLTMALLSSCDFIGNALTYRETSKEFMHELLQKNYDKCVELSATKHPLAANTNIEDLKTGFENFHDVIVKNFGEKLDYTFMTAKKEWSSNESENTPPNTTVVLMQIASDKEFGILRFLFDDNSKKILSIQPLNVKAAIPGMTTYWLFGLLALSIPVFNIYVIRKVRRSQFRKKWLKYLAIIILNVPAVTYNAVNGLTIGFLSFQILLGVSFEYMGYLDSAWSFGLPLGGLYILWQLHKGKDKPIEIPLGEIADAQEADIAPTES